MKDLKKIILINGLPRAGKDTVADYLVQNYSYTKLSFAAPLKSIIANTLGVSLEQLEEYKNNPEDYGIELKAYQNNQPSAVMGGINFRELLQKFGTEGMKPEFGNDVWADLLYNKISRSSDKLFVVSDYRFLAEFQMPENTQVLKILIKDERELPLEGHASDVELYQNNVEFDYTIINTGTLDELYENINIVINQI